MNFRYDIQGLRALAVLLVFIFHLNASWIPGGFIGVDIFFVISGYLVSSIILHKKEKGTFGFLDFYIGRIKRIVPVFLIMLIAVGLVGSYIYLSSDIYGLRKNIFWSTIFNSNNYFAGLDSYFGASAQENPLLHTWTLSLEMQFYFLLPLFLIVVKKKYVPAISMFLITLLFAYSFYNSTFLNNQSGMYFSLIARMPEFLIGTVFAIKSDAIKKLIGSKQNAFAMMSFIGIVVCGFVYNESFNFPGLWVILPCLFAATLLVTTESTINKGFSNKVLVRIGELSYSIYFWHWAIMAFVRYYFNRIDFTWYEMIGIVALTYVLAWLSFTYVEDVYRTYANKKFFIRFSLIIGCVAGIVVTLPRINSTFSNIPDIYSRPVFGMKSHSWSFEEVEYFGDQTQDSTSFVLIGDSHALVYKRFFDVIGNKSGFKFATVTNDLYANIPNLSSDDFNGMRYYVHYQDMMKHTDSLIKNSDVIVLSCIWSSGFKSFPEAFGKMVDELKENQQIIILSDFPTLDKNPLKETRSIVRGGGDHVEFDVKINDIPKYVYDIVEKNEKVKILTFDYSLLLNNIPYVNDTLIYYDEGHLNFYGATKLGEYYTDYITEFLNQNKIVK